ncbi:hypothetical protein EDD21DRAFT_440402, partial [Dissophora ornata]
MAAFPGMAAAITMRQPLVLFATYTVTPYTILLIKMHPTYATMVMLSMIAYITAVVALLPNAFCFLRRFRRTQEDTNSKAENSEHDDETTSLGKFRESKRISTICLLMWFSAIKVLIRPSGYHRLLGKLKCQCRASYTRPSILHD